MDLCTCIIWLSLYVTDRRYCCLKEHRCHLVVWRTKELGYRPHRPVTTKTSMIQWVLFYQSFLLLSLALSVREPVDRELQRFLQPLLSCADVTSIFMSIWDHCLMLSVQIFFVCHFFSLLLQGFVVLSWKGSGYESRVTCLIHYIFLITSVARPFMSLHSVSCRLDQNCWC